MPVGTLRLDVGAAVVGPLVEVGAEFVFLEFVVNFLDVILVLFVRRQNGRLVGFGLLGSQDAHPTAADHAAAKADAAQDDEGEIDV